MFSPPPQAEIAVMGKRNDNCFYYSYEPDKNHSLKLLFYLGGEIKLSHDTELFSKQGESEPTEQGLSPLSILCSHRMAGTSPFPGETAFQSFPCLFSVSGLLLLAEKCTFGELGKGTFVGMLSSQ